uniref:Uncharacterized protein n=1 Tax=Anguilla anguilla TaxID=7936 RepID=A0A0E9T096_ANGAN
MYVSNCDNISQFGAKYKECTVQSRSLSNLELSENKMSAIENEGESWPHLKPLFHLKAIQNNNQIIMKCHIFTENVK